MMEDKSGDQADNNRLSGPVWRSQVIAEFLNQNGRITKISELAQKIHPYYGTANSVKPEAVQYTHEYYLDVLTGKVECRKTPVGEPLTRIPSLYWQNHPIPDLIGVGTVTGKAVLDQENKRWVVTYETSGFYQRKTVTINVPEPLWPQCLANHVFNLLTNDKTA